MERLRKILEYINEQSEAECGEVLKNAREECERTRIGYARLEQEEYWKYINSGSKESEHRLEQLHNLASMESRKQLLSTQEEMVNEAFTLAANKLMELPEQEYAKLLARLDFEDTCNAEDLVVRYRNELALKVASVLFD